MTVRDHSDWPQASDRPRPDERPPAPPPSPRLEIHLSIDHERTDRVIGLLEQILTRVKQLQAQGGRMTTNVKEIQDKLAEISADVESETDIVTSIDLAFTGQNALILDLGEQLRVALENNDPAGLQAVLDSLNTIGTTNAANKDRLVQLVLKGTPADPEPPIAI